jgi:hypothetical protein
MDQLIYPEKMPATAIRMIQGIIVDVSGNIW